MYRLVSPPLSPLAVRYQREFIYQLVPAVRYQRENIERQMFRGGVSPTQVDQLAVMKGERPVSEWSATLSAIIVTIFTLIRVFTIGINTFGLLYEIHSKLQCTKKTTGSEFGSSFANSVMHYGWGLTVWKSIVHIIPCLLTYIYDI